MSDATSDAVSADSLESMTSTRPLAVVTGASSGIGRELARTFAGNGYDVVVTAEDDAIQAVGTELRSLGVLASCEQVDLARPEGVEQLVHAITAAGRPVAALAVNAGIGVGGRFDQTDLDADLRLIDLNVRSSVHLTKLVLRDMVRRGEGRILITASVVAATPGPFHATYAASKAFLHSFAEALHHELDDSGVTVTSLMPGPTETEFFERAGMQDTKVGSSDKDDPAEVARQGFEALMSGKDRVVAGSRMNRVQVAAGNALPDSAAASAAAKMAKPGSGKS
jgi:short-subunit dehydrogenase